MPGLYEEQGENSESRLPTEETLAAKAQPDFPNRASAFDCPLPDWYGRPYKLSACLPRRAEGTAQASGLSKLETC